MKHQGLALEVTKACPFDFIPSKFSNEIDDGRFAWRLNLLAIALCIICKQMNNSFKCGSDTSLSVLNVFLVQNEEHSTTRVTSTVQTFLTKFNVSSTHALIELSVACLFWVSGRGSFILDMES